MTSISDMSREDLLTMIRNTVRDEIQAVVKQEVSDRLDRFEQQLTQLSALQQQMSDVTASIDFTSKKLEDLKSSSLPAFYSHVERIAEALAMQTLDLDLHRRKWSLTINGIKGASGEDDVDTRNAWPVTTGGSQMPTPTTLPLAIASRAKKTPGSSWDSATCQDESSGSLGRKTWEDTLTPLASVLTCPPFFVRVALWGEKPERTLWRH